jgi:CheY-like chemotaxis protein
MDFTGQGTILLVEDEEGLRALMARGLRSRGFDVIEAANGVEALRALQGRAVDLVVSDVVMPEMDGPTLLGRRPDLKVLFISGYEKHEEQHSQNDPACYREHGVPLMQAHIGGLPCRCREISRGYPANVPIGDTNDTKIVSIRHSDDTDAV